jgi:hypothetical protein
MLAMHLRGTTLIKESPGWGQLAHQPKEDFHTMKMNQKFHKGDGRPMTTLDVEQMGFSRDEMLNAQVWLEEFMLGDTQDAAHARAVYSFSTAMATAISRLRGEPVDSGDDNISYMLSPTDPNTLGDKDGD